MASAGRRVGVRPGPRILIVGFRSDDRLRQQLLEIGPTTQLISTISEVRQAEWDCLITDEPFISVVPWPASVCLEAHLRVIYFVGRTDSEYIDEVLADVPLPNSSLRAAFNIIHTTTIVNEFHRPADLGIDERISRLANETLLPQVRRERTKQVFKAWSDDDQMEGIPAADQNMVRLAAAFIVSPFLKDADGQSLAGWYQRTPMSPVWLLPECTPDKPVWVKTALRVWHDQDLTRFPLIIDWSGEPEWQTPQERSLATRLAQTKVEHEQAIEVFQRQEIELAAELEAARDVANSSVRELLTSQGDRLVNRVALSLSALGFKVTRQDELATEGDKLEDLRVRDPDHPNWIALAEVRGYKGGAALNDLLRIERFVTRFVVETGATPSAAWYIVNHFADRDPGSRPRPLVSNPLEAKTFFDGGGLILNTVDLFRLLRQVEDGEISKEDAKSLIRERQL
jgi:hypothetical protein